LAACTAAPPAPGLSPIDAAKGTLSDEFSPANPAWALFDTAEGAAYAQQGELYLEDRGQGVGIYTRLIDYTWEDTVVAVQVRQVEGTQNNWMGVTCRQQDEENYYLFAISADGYYLIMKVEDGLRSKLAGPVLSPVITPGRETNRLEVSCEGPRLSLSVNGQLLVTRTDVSFGAGSIALFADAAEVGSPPTAAFDAFSISDPREQEVQTDEVATRNP
jgi:hypothetical protein